MGRRERLQAMAMAYRPDREKTLRTSQLWGWLEHAIS